MLLRLYSSIGHTRSVQMSIASQEHRQDDIKHVHELGEGLPDGGVKAACPNM